MKAYNKKMQLRHEEIQSEQKRLALEAKLASMTPEERAQYDKEQEENHKKAMEALHNYALVSSMVKKVY